MLNTRVSTGVAGGLLAISLILTGCGGSTATAPAKDSPINNVRFGLHDL